MSKYSAWYDRIMNRAKDRKLDCYSEKHHILPKSLGGKYTPENLVKLTYREHFLAHWLLTKMFEGDRRKKMLYALAMMSCRVKGRGHKIVGWQFAAMRRAAHDARSNRIVSEETRRKLSVAHKGRKATPEARANLSKSRVGNKNRLGILHTEEIKQQIGQSLKGNTHTKGYKYPDDIKAKFSQIMYDRHQRPGVKEQYQAMATKRTRLPNGRWA